MKKLYQFLKFVRAFWVMVKDPTKTEVLFSMLNHRAETRAMSICIETAKKDLDVKKLIDERYLEPLADLQTLKGFEDGTLGKEYWRFLTSNGLKPDFHLSTLPKVSGEGSYLQVRGRQIHDYWHVALGYGMDHNGELALQAFMLAQFNSPLPAFLFAVGFLHTLLFNPSNMRNLMVSIVEGWSTGLKAKPFLAVRWDQQLDQKISEIRKSLNIPEPTLPASISDVEVVLQGKVEHERDGEQSSTTQRPLVIGRV